MKNLTLAAAMLVSSFLAAQTTLLPFGSNWKYLDNGSNQGTAWRTTSFSDGTWKSGPAELGYGDGDEATRVSYGSSSSNKYITTYFRKAISITNPAQFSTYTFKVKRDDGVVVYVNGVEVFRSNLPTGTITYTTLASAASDGGETPQTFTCTLSVFSSGTNVIAAEIHQTNSSSSDISFDLELAGSSATTSSPPVSDNKEVTRGPYQQMVNQTGATLRWRTATASNSKIEVGTTFGSYTKSATNTTSSTAHEVRITGLAPGTRYYYRFGSTTKWLQGSTANSFTTAPAASSTKKIRIAAFGDCGKGNDIQIKVLNAYLNFVRATPVDLMLLLGDNAYLSGTDAEYQSRFFVPYSGTVLKNHALYATPGNHDYAESSSRQADHNIPYYSIFSLPRNAECGGIASGTEAYYSFDWGNIHFVSLDSYGKENGGTTRLYDTLGAQITWLKKDLAANSKKWTIVFFHHPPFTKGTHDSDGSSELSRIRLNLVRILERYGVDLVLCGHSHVYERSYLLRGYYGTESSFSTSTHTLTTSSGKYNGSSNSCPLKTISGKFSHGTVYVVSGTAAMADQAVKTGFPHNALPFATRAAGMFYFEVEANRLDAKFIRQDGVVSDQFTIMKDVGKTSNLSVTAGTTVTLTASWLGTYRWTNGATTRSIRVTPGSTATYKVTDNNNCLADVFNVRVIATVTNMKRGEVQAADEDAGPVIFPTLVIRGNSLTIQTGTNEVMEAAVVDNTGRTIYSFTFTGTGYVNTSRMVAGTYYIIASTNRKIFRQRFAVVD